MTIYKYWVYKDQLTGLVEDPSLITDPLPEGWGVYDSDSLLAGYPDEYRLDGGVLVRRAPPPPPNALQLAMSTNPTVLEALTRVRLTSPVAALLVQLVVAHIEQNLELAEDALDALPKELKAVATPK
jgi:hypothetical protein